MIPIAKYNALVDAYKHLPEHSHLRPAFVDVDVLSNLLNILLAMTYEIGRIQEELGTPRVCKDPEIKT